MISIIVSIGLMLALIAFAVEHIIIKIKTKKINDFEELLNLQNDKIKRIEDKNSNFASSFVFVPVPQPNDMLAYHQKMAALIDDPLYLFYISQLRRCIVDEFEASSEKNSEFYRGKLVAIGDIILDARKAKNQLGAV